MTYFTLGILEHMRTLRKLSKKCTLRDGSDVVHVREISFAYSLLLQTIYYCIEFTQILYHVFKFYQNINLLESY